MAWTNDPIADFNRHDAKQHEWLKNRPECVDCGEHIQDEHCYEFNGEYLCERCLIDLHRKDVDDCVS